MNSTIDSKTTRERIIEKCEAIRRTSRNVASAIYYAKKMGGG